MITCRVCHEGKGQEEFNRDRSRRLGRRTICRTCQRDQKRRHIVATPVVVQEPLVEAVVPEPVVMVQEPEIETEPEPEIEVEPEPEPLRVCRVCRVGKTIDQYHKDRTKKSGYRGECRTCKAISDSSKTKLKRIAAQQSVISKEDQQASQANQIALKALVQRHEREFLRLRESARRNLGMVPKWRQLG